MNIIFIEDDARLLDIEQPLKNRGHRVIYCKNMSTAMQCIGNEDTRNQVDVIVLDLSMDAIGLSDDLREESAKTGLAGWVFYDKILRNYNEGLCEKTIFYTGFGNRLIDEKIIQEEEFNQLCIVHKQGGGSAEKLLKEIESLRNKTRM